MKPVSRLYLIALVPAIIAGLSCDVFSQMVTTSSPFNSVRSSFTENIGSSWSLKGNGWNFGFNGGVNPGASQFGGTPGGVSGGVGFGNKNFSGQFFGNFGQGSSRSFVSQTPSVTTFNGVPGMISDTQLSPFVIGNTPIVGHWANNNIGFMDPTGGALSGNFNVPSEYNSPVSQALNRVRVAEMDPNMSGNPEKLRQAALGGLPAPKKSTYRNNGSNNDSDDSYDSNTSGNHGGLVITDSEPSSAEVAVGSLDEMKRLRDQDLQPQLTQMQSYLDRARRATQDGRPKLAKSHYRSAYKLAPDDQTKKQIEDEYRTTLR